MDARPKQRTSKWTPVLVSLFVGACVLGTFFALVPWGSVVRSATARPMAAQQPQAFDLDRIDSESDWSRLWPTLKFPKRGDCESADAEIQYDKYDNVTDVRCRWYIRGENGPMLELRITEEGNAAYFNKSPEVVAILYPDGVVQYGDIVILADGVRIDPMMEPQTKSLAFRTADLVRVYNAKNVSVRFFHMDEPMDSGGRNTLCEFLSYLRP